MPAGDPRFTVLGDLMEGWHPVGFWGLKMEAYFAWVASQGFALPDNPWDIWLPQGLAAGDIGATDKPARIPKALSDTVWFTERGLDHLRGAGERPWFLHLGYYRPHPPYCAPAPYHAMVSPADCPRPVRAPTAAQEARQHPLLRFYLESIQRRSFFENGQGLASDMSEAEVLQMRATYYGLMTEVDDQLGRVFEYLKRTGQWDDTLILLTSDHGEQLGDHHLLGKIGYFDQSYHIPMIVRDPDAAAQSDPGPPRRAVHRSGRRDADDPRLAVARRAARLRRPLADALPASGTARRMAGGAKRTTNSTIATSSTASPRRRSASTWTNARSRSCRTSAGSTCISRPRRRCCSICRTIRASS